MTAWIDHDRNMTVVASIEGVQQARMHGSWLRVEFDGTTVELHLNVGDMRLLHKHLGRQIATAAQ
jgi:hypothetical protein